MNISAILVCTPPEHLLPFQESLNALPWAEVHHVEEDGRMIVIVEGENTEEDLARIKALKAMPHAISATMIQYCFEDEMQEMWDATHQADPEHIPQYLDNNDMDQKAPGVYQSMKGLSDF